MDRDLVVFLDHTNQHVIDRIKQAHPEWITENGACQPCVAYYEGQLSGEIGNIGPAGQRSRLVLGIMSLLIAVGGFSYFVAARFPSSWQWSLFVPLFFGTFVLIQARETTCSVLAEM
jgi:hypothetical protein